MGFCALGGRFSSSSFVMTARRQDTRARTEISPPFSSSRLMLETAFAPPLSPPTLAVPPSHAHAPLALCLLIIGFIITCRMTCMHLLYDFKQRANVSYATLLCCHCTGLRYIFISSLHMSLYPGYSGLQDPKSSFL